MQLRQYMVARAQEPSLIAGANSLLTKETIVKRRAQHFDGALIGHHLSIMKLSTDYHRWNVIRCLMSSQASLKQ